MNKNAGTTIAIALLTSAATATLTSMLMQTRTSGERAADSPPSVDLRIERLLQRLDELERGLARIGSSSRQERVSQPGADHTNWSARSIEAAVDRVLARRAKSEAAAARPEPFDVMKALRDLRDPTVSKAHKDDIWARLRDAGQLATIDALVAEFEKLAKVHHADSAIQTELAHAYQQRMLSAKTGPERGRWGGRAAKTLERALELDEANWGARFALATHSYYAGMRGDAIRHFETLLKQQEGRHPEAKHARAYVWLGNIHMDRGDTAVAKRVWGRGLALFPGDAELRRRLDAFR